MKQLFFILLLFCLSLPVVAQLFPVESQLAVRPPSSVYLSDFTELGSERLTFMLNFTDTNEPDYDVRLHLRLEGAGVVLATSPNFNPAPLTLRSDGMRSLELIEWSEYLDPDNLVIVGLDQGQFRASGGKLPEGMYQLCLTVRDYRRPDVDLSRENCTLLNLRKNNPPQAFVPTCGGTVQPTPNNQVQLNWQANHDALVNAQYTIDMVKVEPGQDPNQAVISGSQRLLPDVEVNNMTSYLIDPADPMSAELIYGETYAYRINVTDLDGLTTFENDGIGEVCWFTYGFLPGGLLGVNFPQENGRVNPNQPLTFRWNGPTNATAGTRIYYKVRVADITDLPAGSDPEEALLNPNLLIDEQTSVTGNLSSWNFTYDGELETERKLVWKVEAFVDDTQNEDVPLAESEVVSFRTTPLLDRFRAGQYTVLVNTAGNSTVDDFSGTGTVRINEDLNVDVQFEGLNIQVMSTANVLRDGIIISPLDEDIELEHPEGGSVFEASQLELDKDNLRVRGRITHQFGLNAENEASSFAKIQSPERLLGFEGGQLVGSGNFEAKSIQPVDLPGLTIQYDASSTWSVDRSVLEYSFNGKYQLLDPVSYMEGQTVEYVFSDQPSLYRQNLVLPGLGQELQLTQNDRISLLVKVLEIDFTDGESPEDSGLDDFWTGFYVKQGRVFIPTDFHSPGAIVPLEEVEFGLDELEGPVTFASQLTLGLEKEWAVAARPRASFYGFLDDWHGIKLAIDDGVLTSGELRGDVSIPFISNNENQRFDFETSITTEGVAPAWLQSIEGVQMDLEGDPGEKDDIRIVVTNGHFVGNDQIQLTVNIWLGAFETTLRDISGLTLWGNGAVGFNGEEHGVANAHENLLIKANEFPGTLKNFGISYQFATETARPDSTAPDGLTVWNRRVRYLFAYEADVNLGNFLSSSLPGNSPAMAFALDEYRNIDVLLPDDYTSDLEGLATAMPDKWTDYWEALQSSTDTVPPPPDMFNEQGLPLLLAQVASSAIPGIANVSIGRLEYIYDPVDWGGVFGLTAAIELLQPFAMTVSLDVIAGHTPWVNDPSEGFAYTSVTLSLKDGTVGSSQGLDNQLQTAKTTSSRLKKANEGLTDKNKKNFDQLTNLGKASDQARAPEDENGKKITPGVEFRYLAVAVHINMDYGSGTTLQPARNSYGGMVGANIRMTIPPGSDGMTRGAAAGKQRLEIGFAFEMIISESLGVRSASGALIAKYTEDADKEDVEIGGNAINFSLAGSFNWASMLFRGNAALDVAAAPLCLNANAGLTFQLDPRDPEKLRMLEISAGSYANPLVVQYCQVVKGGGMSGAGFSFGHVGWLQLRLGYGLPSALLPRGINTYAEINPDLAYLDDRTAALGTLSASEQGIIEAALTDPTTLPPEILADSAYDSLLLEYQDTYGVQVWNGELGIGSTASIEARTSEWIDLLVIRVMPYASASVRFVAYGQAQFAPVFAIDKIGVELNGNATVGVYYEELNGFEYSGNVKNWVFLSITLNARAELDWRTEIVKGNVSAQVQIIQLPTGGFLVDIPVEIPFEFSTGPS